MTRPLMNFLVLLVTISHFCQPQRVNPVEEIKTPSGITISITQFQYQNGSSVMNTNTVNNGASNANGSDNKTSLNNNPQNASPPENISIQGNQSVSQSTLVPPGDYMFGVIFNPEAGVGYDGIQQMLRVTLTKFNFISTNSMGVSDMNYNGQWNGAGSESLISTAAARINLESKTLRLRVCQGARLFQKSVRQPDLENALASAANANQVWPGTVWGISLHMDNEWGSVQDKEGIGHVISTLIDMSFLERAHQLGLKVGAKLDICSEIVDGMNKDKLRELAKSADFVVCFIYPPNNTEEPTKGVAKIAEIYSRYQTAFARANPKLQVIIETGWASEGVSDFNPAHLNTVAKQTEFWKRVQDWSVQTRVSVHMFEAFDSNKTNALYRHFGYWQISDSNYFVQKSSAQAVKY